MCSGECCVCYCGGSGCIAGRGDDYFMPASKEQIIDNLDKGKYPSYVEYMIEHLKTVFGYVYDPKDFGRKRMEPADVVEVVRCQDCKYRTTCDLGRIVADGNWFCANGKRKNGVRSDLDKLESDLRLLELSIPSRHGIKRGAKNERHGKTDSGGGPDE